MSSFNVSGTVALSSIKASASPSGIGHVGGAALTDDRVVNGTVAMISSYRNRVRRSLLIRARAYPKPYS